QKRKVFLIIGLTKEATHWDERFRGLLTEKLGLGHDAIVAVDLPGTGIFLQDESPSHIRGIVEMTRARYLHEMVENEERLLIAISLGGMIAMEWVNLFPDDFHKMVILNSSFRGLSPVHKRLQPDAMKTFVRIFRAKSIEERERKVIELCCNDTSQHPRVLKKWVDIARQRPMSRKNMVRQTLAAARYTFRTSPRIPVFVIAARHDRLASFTCSVALHSQMGGDLHIFEDEKIGHAIHTDAPEQLVQQIAKWLERRGWALQRLPIDV
ncbi:MAG: alpha/beta hydrolase, partial [Myxococcota bacterium]|nr:alpha/beta hydrolase [Myxococcota bacterium]